MIALADVEHAAARLEGRVHRTPLLSARRIADAAGVATLSLKCESLQKTGSFKARGALNRIALLDDEARARGVITVSAGNHAQAIAFAAREARVAATVVMPETASRAKVAASRGYGAEVVLHGRSSIDAFRHARELGEARALTFLHPFDDDAIIAGQGTVGLEILEDAGGAVDDIVVPVGGGGLISGIAVAVAARQPAVRVYGVEPEGAAVIRRSLDAGSPQRLERIDTIADGLAAPMAGERTFEIIRRHVADVVLVSDDEIAAAMRRLLFSAKLLAEPAGAAGVAALLARRLPLAGRRVVAVVSGGNVDPALLGRVIAADDA